MLLDDAYHTYSMIYTLLTYSTYAIRNFLEWKGYRRTVVVLVTGSCTVCNGSEEKSIIALFSERRHASCVVKSRKVSK
jgi:hypothetical protein